MPNDTEEFIKAEEQRKLAQGAAERLRLLREKAFDLATLVDE